MGSVVSAFSQNETPVSKTFRVNYGDYSIELNPLKSQTTQEAQLFTAFYEGLVVYDPLSLRPSPGAAEKWEFSDNGKSLTFKLRKNLQFSDGTPLTAKDFLETWFLVIDPKTAAPFAALLDEVKGVQEWREGSLSDRSQVGLAAPDDTTLVLTLKEQAPHILSILCHYAFVPLHPQVRKNPTSNITMVNGPFRPKVLEAKHWVLEKNPFYWDAANVKMNNIDITFNNDSVAVTNLFREGAYDWIADSIDGNSIFNSRLISAVPLFGTSFLYFQTGHNPWDDARVRKALTLLLPLEELRSPYIQATSVLIPSFTGYPKPQSLGKQNTDEALALLKEAGYPEGKGLPPLNLVFPESNESKRITEVLTKAWGDTLHLEVRVQTIADRYYETLAHTPHDMGFFSWVGDFLDPMTFLVLWKKGSSLNSFGFSDAGYEKLLSDAASQSGDQRLKTLSKAEEFLLTQALLIPLYHNPGFNLIDPDAVGGWYANPMDIHPFKNIYIKPSSAIKNVVKFDLN